MLAGVKTRLLLATLLLASCDRSVEDAATLADVPVIYLSRLPAGCPDAGSSCAAECSRHDAAAGLRVIVPLWDVDSVPLTQAGDRRFEGVLPKVPVDLPVRLYGRDPAMCCLDACNFPPVLEDIYVNGTKLTKVVHEGLPAGAYAALEFTLTGDGRVRQ